jgi:hypothetical protein
MNIKKEPYPKARLPSFKSNKRFKWKNVFIFMSLFNDFVKRSFHTYLAISVAIVVNPNGFTV